ncbi:unnamed protein product [Cuscuta campestris]|uniref:Uncharacterized protein n=1 Tax=Cuscuta campestris TaxID=132261 RepID=A0A484KRP9_9ASTE|nr:unnamed protein product [Cuscuta campestris]
MAPTNPETWTHGPSIIKENELREVAALLGKGFRVHHPDAVGGISLSYNPNPQKYMVMQYHSVENGFRLPLRGLLRDLCLHFGFAPGQLTANAHKYVASYILRCCALDRTPKLDEFLLLFSIGGFPFYSLYPHNHFPIFEKVEFKYEKWSLRYFVIEFPAHSPLDLPGVVLRRSISRTKFAAAELAEGAFNASREKEGLISHHSLQDAQLYKKAGFYYPLGPDPFPFEGVPSPEGSKAPSAAESNPAMSSTGNQPQGDSTALAICKPVAALEAVPISTIPGLRRPIPSQKQPREGVTDDDFLPKKHRGDGTSVSPSPLSTFSGTQNTTSAAAPGGLELPHPESLDHEADELSDPAPLKKPAVQPQPDANNSLPQTALAPQELEIEVEEQEEPAGSSFAAEVEIEIQKVPDAPSTAEKEAAEQNDAEVPPEMRRETETQQNQEEQRDQEERCPATTPSAVSLPIRRKFTPQTYPVFTKGWASFSRGLRSLQASHWTIQTNLEKMRESVQEPAIPQARPDLLDLNALHFMEQAQQSLLTLTEEYLGGASGNYRGVVLLKEKELAARALQQKEQIASYKRGTHDMEAQFDRLRAQISTLESRASASEDKVGNLEAGLVEKESRISELENSLQEAKHESSRFNEFALKQMEARRLIHEIKGRETDCKVVFIDLTISDSSCDSSSLAFPSLGPPTPELSSWTSLASEQSVTSPLPRDENNPHLPPQVSGGVPPSPGMLLNGARAEASSGRPGTPRSQKRRTPHSGASRLVSGARPSSQGSPSPQQSYGQPSEEWGDYDMGGNRLPFIRREKDGSFRDPPPPPV